MGEGTNTRSVMQEGKTVALRMQKRLGINGDFFFVTSIWWEGTYLALAQEGSEV